MSIAWDPIYSVHIRVIDEQHKRFVGILSELDDAIIEGRVLDELEAIFNELAAYTGVHFSTEEMYFEKFGYEHAAAHKESHAKFIATLANFKEQIKVDPGTFSRRLVEYLQDWLTEHVARADKGYEQCFRDHGLT